MRDARTLHLREWLAPTWSIRAHDLVVVNGGRQSVTPLYRIIYPRCRLHALVYVLAGRGYVSCGGRKHEVGANALFALFQDSQVEYGTDPKQPWQFVWVAFLGCTARALLRQAGLTRARPVLDAKEIVQARSLFLDLQQAGVCGGPGAAHAVLGKLWTIFGFLTAVRRPEGQRVAPDRPWQVDLTTRVAMYLREHMAERLTLAELSHRFHVSPFHLARVFRAELNQSLIDYLIDERVRAAQQMLVEGRKSIAEVAACTSYQDPAYFSRLFKRRTGLSPRQLRRHRA